MSRAKPGLDSHRIGTMDVSINFPLYESLHHLRKMLVEPFAQHRPQHLQNMIFNRAATGRHLLGILIHLTWPDLSGERCKCASGCTFRDSFHQR